MSLCLGLFPRILGLPGPPKPIPTLDVVPTSRLPSIVIIGAGAGGSSAAFWISKAKKRFGLDVGIDIYERSDYIGGLYPYNDAAYEPLELGALIFVEANRNMQRAAHEFNLSLYRFDDEYGDIAVWDGEKILYTIRLPFAEENAGASMTDKVVTLYEPEAQNWSSIEELNDAFDWTELTSRTGAEYFEGHDVSQKFAHEAIGVGTRINYAQNIDGILGLGATVSLAASGGVRVKGGNRKIFEQFVERSGTQVFLRTKVVGIERHSDRGWTIVTEEEHRDYDAVIIAAPYHSSHISLRVNLTSLIPTQPYVRLHITLLTTTTASPNPVYFGHKPGSKVATNIFATFGGARDGVRAPELSYQGQTKFAKNETHDEKETGKISSPEPISDEWLAAMFNN
ncbi:hypothetical protein BC827DRAFT_1265775 [Russula dissimulans]|nr:hypothetical protein BC827DRAFT_1265775 [Russula dissimulans]